MQNVAHYTFTSLAFVDCSIKFVEGGAFKCLTSRIDRGPICKIKCFAYIHVPVLPSAIYECDIEGKWHPTQPRCIGPSGKVIHNVFGL